MKRTLTFVYDSNIDDKAWQAMVAGLVETAEQDACSYAASVREDEYTLYAFAGRRAGRNIDDDTFDRTWSRCMTEQQRFTIQPLDPDAVNLALTRMVTDEFCYLDDPAGSMVAFVVDEENGVNLTTVLNRGVTPEQLEGEGFDWRIHGHLDWPGEQAPGGPLHGASHYGIFMTRLANGEVMLLADDENGGEICAFIFAERAAELVAKLNTLIERDSEICAPSEVVAIRVFLDGATWNVDGVASDGRYTESCKTTGPDSYDVDELIRWFREDNGIGPEVPVVRSKDSPSVGVTRDRGEAKCQRCGAEVFEFPVPDDSEWPNEKLLIWTTADGTWGCPPDDAEGVHLHTPVVQT